VAAVGVVRGEAPREPGARNSSPDERGLLFAFGSTSTLPSLFGITVTHFERRVRPVILVTSGALRRKQ
jgi:hypothetical protein